MRLATYLPFDSDRLGGPTRHVTLAMCRRLVRLAMKVARDAADANVVEEARRIADELRAAARDQYRGRRREAMRARRVEGAKAA